MLRRRAALEAPLDRPASVDPVGAGSVYPCASKDDVAGAVAGVEAVTSRRSAHAVGSATAGEAVVPRATHKPVVPRATHKPVGMGSAEEEVATCTSYKLVAIASTENAIGSATAREAVIPSATHEPVVAGGPKPALKPPPRESRVSKRLASGPKTRMDAGRR